MLGVARLTKETGNPGEGEFAIVVRDEFQGLGIGKQLMDALIFAARDMHIREIRGDVLRATRRCCASPSRSVSRSGARMTPTSARSC